MFKALSDAGFLTELLPILPPDATIAVDSKSHDNLVESRGKVPGKRTSRGDWYGFGQWSVHRADSNDVAEWSGWGAGVGLQGRQFPGIDIDVLDGALADAIELEACFTLGLAPARFGRGARRLLVYRGEGFTKRRVAFCLPGGDEVAAAQQAVRPDDAVGGGGQELLAQDGKLAAEIHAVEFLATGQQYLVEGIHPKTGQPYYWRDGLGLEWIGPDGLVEVTAEDLDAFFERVGQLAVEHGYEIVSTVKGSTQGNAPITEADAPSLDAVRGALAAIPNTDETSYDDWVAVGMAVRGAGGDQAEAFALWDEWSAQRADNDTDQNEIKWRTFEGTHVGWQWLAQKAFDSTGYNKAQHDFEPEPDEGGEISEPGPKPDSARNMLKRYAWVEGAKRAVHLETGALLDQEQFEFRIPPKMVASGRMDSAWKVFKEAVDQRTSYQNLTFRPGRGREIYENLPDLEGLCFNIWRDPGLDLPQSAENADVAPWLELAAVVIPDAEERRHVMDYFAFTLQHQDVKINHALVLGSRNEGVGKDTLLDPVRIGVGRRYVREIGPEALTSQFNAFAMGSKLVVIQEMHNFERKATMNLLKPLVAAPPEALQVNLKGRTQFYVPNICSTVFFTNENDALALSKGDRRYFITWNDAEPMPDAYFAAYRAWADQGGVRAVVRWLLQRDLSGFNAKGRAPETAAKEKMRLAALPPLEAALQEGLADLAALGQDLVVTDDLVSFLPEAARGHGGRAPTGTKMAYALEKLGAVAVTPPIRVQTGSHQRRIWCLSKRATLIGQLQPDQVRDEYLAQLKEAERRRGAA